MLWRGAASSRGRGVRTAIGAAEKRRKTKQFMNPHHRQSNENFYKSIDELPVLDVSWCARQPSPEGPWCQRLWPPGPDRFITLIVHDEQESDEQEIKLAQTLGINGLEQELLRKATQVAPIYLGAEERHNSGGVYVFGKVVPVGRTLEGELIVAAFKIALEDRWMGVLSAPAEVNWIGFLCRPEHFEAIKQIVASQITEYRDYLEKIFSSIPEATIAVYELEL